MTEINKKVGISQLESVVLINKYQTLKIDFLHFVQKNVFFFI